MTARPAGDGDEPTRASAGAGLTAGEGSGSLVGEVVRNVDDALAVSAEWRALAERLGNPFITPEWFLAWQRHYGDLDEPYVVVLRDESRVVRGVVPLVARRHGPVRTLRFAGGPLGDRFEPACDPRDRDAAASAVAACLQGRRRDWSALVLDWVEEGSGWLEAMLGSPPRMFSRTRFRTTPLPYIDLTGLSWEEYLRSRSRNFRSQLGRRARALERDHGVQFRQVSDPAGVAPGMRTLFSLHADRWREKGVSSLASDRRRRFLTEFAELALGAGWLRLWFLELDAMPVASWYGWRVGDRYAYYQAGLEPDYGSYSVGFVLLARTVEAACAEGAGEYDLLRGDEEYKRRFTSASRQAATWIVVPRHHPLRLAIAAAVGARAALRRLPRSMLDPLKRALGRRDSA